MMSLRFLGFLLIALVGLTACGGEPEQVKMDRRFLAGEELEQQLASLRASVKGEVLDAQQWVQGEENVFTMLSREADEKTNFNGLYLRHYRVGKQSPELLWTYQDSVSCGAAAGARLVVSRSTPGLRPAHLTNVETDQFVLSYELHCGSATEKTLAIINAASGTPDLRLYGDDKGLHDASALIGLPEDTIQRLLAYWE